MSFLTPLPAILTAAVGVPALLLLYLLKLKRIPVRVGSTLLWERAISDLEVNEPFRWLRMSAIFIAQLLAILLLAAALGRPVLGHGDSTASRQIILIDRSASMNAQDDPAGSTRLSAALERARTRADRVLDSGASVLIADFAAQTRVLTGMTADRGAVRRAINGITPTDQPGDLARALETLSAINTGDESGSVDVVLYSDGSFGGSESLVLQGGALEFERVGPDVPELNTGVIAIGARRDPADPSLVRIFARLRTNATETNSSETNTGFPVRLHANAQPVDRTYASFDGSDDVGVAFQWRSPDAALLTIEVVTQDTLSADNRASLAIRGTEPPRIDLVQRDTASPDAWVVRDLLEAIAPGAVRTRTVDEAADSNASPATLTVFDRVSPDTLPAHDAILLGAAADLPGLEWGETQNRPATVLSWDRDHPLLTDVSLDGVLIERWRPLRIDQTEAAIDNSEDEDSAQISRFDFRRLATGPAGAMIVSGRSPSGRRLIATAFAPADSSWALDFGFTVFMANAIEWLSGFSGAEQARWFETGQPVTAIVPPGTTVARFTGPADLQARAQPGTEFASLGIVDLAGVYIGPGQTTVPVNLLDETESAIAIENDIVVSGESAAGVRAANEPREIWRWFVLAAASLFALEWIWYGWSMRT